MKKFFNNEIKMEEKVQGHREGQKIEHGNFLLHVVFMQFGVNVISFLWNKWTRKYLGVNQSLCVKIMTFIFCFSIWR